MLRGFLFYFCRKPRPVLPTSDGRIKVFLNFLTGVYAFGATVKGFKQSVFNYRSLQIKLIFLFSFTAYIVFL